MIFPAITETLVLPLNAVEIEDRIREGIENKKFNGAIGNGSFSLSACLVRPPQFSPMVRGRIESSSRGSLIFIRYELMPATKTLLIFMTVVAVLVTVQLLVVSVRLSAYVFLPLALLIVFRSVALVNIRLHRDPVRQNLLDILS